MHRLPLLNPSRRYFLRRASASSIAALAGLDCPAAQADAPPEVSRIRIVHVPAVCFAPQYLAEELLHLEGFTDVEYLSLGTRSGPDCAGRRPCGHHHVAGGGVHSASGRRPADRAARRRSRRLLRAVRERAGALDPGPQGKHRVRLLPRRRATGPAGDHAVVRGDRSRGR